MDDVLWAELIGDGKDEAGVLSSGQYDALASAAWAANRRDADVPFSPAVSTPRPTFAGE
jgi:hypothetical protein